ncbi:MAG: hypothetical protein H0U56_15830 [Methylibium sp.]|uniref:hypothetical protein n=1 Tax=Methylibium sp. TaxID=2067992 RepID=UPI0017F3B9B6|nr:hypothetical protein [Methylibium sp.]MBA2724321.1 hypothetical protein [Methylibium sp.]MBA3591224.1 hypothetical protein [Methylibium sp.]
MIDATFELDPAVAPTKIRHISAVPPVTIPVGHVGPVVLPGSGRTIWWTGRVAIGLRHQPERRFEEITQSAMWVQGLMLNGGRHARGAQAA